MTDGNLFDCTEGPEGERYRPARRADPDTSKEAADKIMPNITEQRAWVVECITETQGLTSNELSVEHCPGNERKIGRRLCECERLGLIRRGPARKCGETGFRAATWYPA